MASLSLPCNEFPIGAKDDGCDSNTRMRQFSGHRDSLVGLKVIGLWYESEYLLGLCSERSNSISQIRYVNMYRSSGGVNTATSAP